MKRQKPYDGSVSRVYSYGCLAPTSGAEAIFAESQRQHDLWDQLVDLWHATQRRQIDAARADDPELARVDDEISALSADIDGLVKERRGLRAKSRKAVDTPEIDARILARVEARRPLYVDRTERMSAWKKANKGAVSALWDEFNAAKKEARQNSPAWWHNYNRVLSAFDIATKRAAPRRRDRRRRDGVICWQIQKTEGDVGARIDYLLSGRFAALRFERVDDRKYTLRMRVGAGDGGAHPESTIPVIVHRLPPSGARIKAVQLTWRPIGTRLQWQLALTLVMPDDAAKCHPSRSAVGIDLGWRDEGDGRLLIATCSDGERVHLPPRITRQWDKVRDLESILSRHTIELAQSWFGRLDELPDELRLPLVGWRPGRSDSHVYSTALAAHIRSMPDRQTIPPGFARWYERYRHLTEWRDHQEAKVQRCRREFYRLAARAIAANHAVIVLEDFDLSEVARVKKIAPGKKANPLTQHSRRNRQQVALSHFRKELTEQARKAGARIELVEPAYTTRECSACGARMDMPDPMMRRLSCECGAQHDCDENAAVNILERWMRASTPPVKRAA